MQINKREEEILELIRNDINSAFWEGTECGGEDYAGEGWTAEISPEIETKLLSLLHDFSREVVGEQAELIVKILKEYKIDLDVGVPSQVVVPESAMKTLLEKVLSQSIEQLERADKLLEDK